MRLLTPAAPYNIQQYYITCRRRLDETCTPLTAQCRIKQCVAWTTDHSLPSSWHYSSIKYVKQVNICTTDHIIFTLERHRISNMALHVRLTLFPWLPSRKIQQNNSRVAVKTDSDHKVDDRVDDGKARFRGHWVRITQQWPQFSAP